MVKNVTENKNTKENKGRYITESKRELVTIFVKWVYVVYCSVGSARWLPT